METTVVIGTYNNAAHIRDTLASVRTQDYQDWNGLVIDNGSTDDTVEIVRSLIASDSRFKLTVKRNEGPSSGRNLGISLLPDECRFVHFLDGDDLLMPSFLSRLVGHLDSHAHVGLVACQFNIIDASGTPVGPGHRSRFAASRWGWPRALPDDEFLTPFETFYAATGQGPFAVFRRSVLSRTSGYEPTFWSHEDSDIFCQMALLADVHYLPDRLYAKRTHGNNLTASPNADYGKFRNKWDVLTSPDPQTNERIEAAMRYYYGRHAPLRHFKVSFLALKEFLSGKGVSALTWSTRCFYRGFNDLLLGAELRRRLKLRRGESAPT
jgi:glycosyltransferase involved in cell wall biosynthesis